MGGILFKPLYLVLEIMDYQTYDIYIAKLFMCVYICTYSYKHIIYSCIHTYMDIIMYRYMYIYIQLHMYIKLDINIYANPEK